MKSSDDFSKALYIDPRYPDFVKPNAERYKVYKQKKAELDDKIRHEKELFLKRKAEIKSKENAYIQSGKYTPKEAKALTKSSYYLNRVQYESQKDLIKNDLRELRCLVYPYHFFYKAVKANGSYLIKPQGHALFASCIVLLIGIISMFFMDFDRAQWNGDSFNMIIGNMFGPHEGMTTLTTWDLWFGYMFHTAVPLIWQTFESMFVATTIGCVLSIPFMILCAATITKHPGIYYTFRVLLNILRTIPTMVLGILGVALFGNGTMAGVFAMALFTMGIMIKIMYEYIETIDMHPYEALISTGATKPKAFIKSIAPQIVPSFLANALYTFEINIRASVVLGFVGAGGIGIEIQQSMELFKYNQVGAIIIPLFVLVLIMQLVSNEVKKRTL